jgi:predicted aldo/keto reductase-like oxidoreductase
MYHNGTSEIAVRKAFIERYPRENFYLADKLPVGFLKSAYEIQATFDQQVERLGGWDKLKYFDNYLLHGLDAPIYANCEKWGAFDFMCRLREEGKIKHLCMSFHDTPELLDKILTAHSEVEVVQLQINYADWNNEAIQSAKCYETALKHGKPVIVMEPVKGGSLAKLPPEAAEKFKLLDPNTSPASWAIRFAASLDNVRVVLSGMSSIEQMKDNISFMKDFKPLSDKEKAVIKEVAGVITGSQAIPCTGCRYCVAGVPPCPKNIPIPDLFSLYNNCKQFGHLWHHYNYYEMLCRQYGNPASCTECGQCESRCPQHIEIRKWIKKAVAELSDMSKIEK